MVKISVKAAWKLGVIAARNGAPLDANPYEPRTRIFESWNDGWRLDQASRKDEKPPT